MKNFRKLIALVMAFIFISCLGLAGCGQGGDDKSGTTSGTAAGTSNETTQVKADPVNIIWYVGKDPMTPSDVVKPVLEDLNKKLVDKINVTLDLRLLEWGEINDKMRMIISSNEEYDLVFTSNWANHFDQNIAKGAFAELDELIDKSAPGLRTAVPAGIMDVARVKGKLYAVPNIQFMCQAYGVYVQKALLDKYNFNLDNVQKFEDLEPFLESIKTNEPGLIPIKPGLPYPFLDNSCDKLNDYVGVKTDDPTFKVFALHGTYYKKGSDFAKHLFEKGYLRKDILTVTDDSADEKANRYAVIYGNCKPGGELETSTKRGVEYKMKQLQEPYISPTEGNSTMTAVNVNSKHQDLAIKLLEVVHTDIDIFNELLYGIENVNYKKVTDNQVEVLDASKYDLYSAAWSLGNQFRAWYKQGQTVGLWEDTEKMNNTAKVSPVRGFIFDSAPIADVIAKVDAVREEFKNIEYLSDYEAKHEQFINKLKVAGLDDIVKETQKQLDEWLAANGKK